MRVSIWDEGPYLGFPDHPALQLQWFIDQALAVKQKRVAAGEPIDPVNYGDWVADVQRPAEEFRGRYQLRLDEARQLIATGCAADAPARGDARGHADRRAERLAPRPRDGRCLGER
jgi:hypothetical protein